MNDPIFEETIGSRNIVDKDKYYVKEIFIKYFRIFHPSLQPQELQSGGERMIINILNLRGQDSMLRLRFVAEEH